jgi:hypothetical protein
MRSQLTFAILVLSLTGLGSPVSSQTIISVEGVRDEQLRDNHTLAQRIASLSASDVAYVFLSSDLLGEVGDALPGLSVRLAGNDNLPGILRGGELSVREVSLRTALDGLEVEAKADLILDGASVPLSVVGFGGIGIQSTAPGVSTVLLTPIITGLELESDQATSLPLTLVASVHALSALLSTGVGIELPGLELPIETVHRIGLPPLEFRERLRLGDASMELIASVPGVEKDLTIALVGALSHPRGLLAVITDAGGLADNPDPIDDQRDSLGRLFDPFDGDMGIYIPGEMLARSVRPSGSIRVPFEMYQRGGRLAGQNLGRDVFRNRIFWEVTLDRGGPVVGHSDISVSVDWTPEGRLRMDAEAILHGAGTLYVVADPGIGGGDTAKPNAHVTGSVMATVHGSMAIDANQQPVYSAELEGGTARFSAKSDGFRLAGLPIPRQSFSETVTLEPESLGEGNMPNLWMDSFIVEGSGGSTHELLLQVSDPRVRATGDGLTLNAAATVRPQRR